MCLYYGGQITASTRIRVDWTGLDCSGWDDTIGSTSVMVMSSANQIMICREKALASKGKTQGAWWISTVIPD